MGKDNQTIEHVVILGGTKGGGRALVRLMDRNGYHVSVVGRGLEGTNDPQLSNTAFFAADVTCRPALPELFARITERSGPVHRLAFFQRFRGVGDTWAGELAAGPTATRDVMDAALGLFASSGDRSIVLIASVAARCVAVEQPVGYHVAKAAMVQLTRYYAALLGPKGIRVNSISPSALIKQESQAFYEGNSELKRLYRDMCPLGRMGTTEELAEACHFFLSPVSSFVTGQDLVLDGGLSLQCQEGLARKIAGLPHPGASQRRA